MDPTPLPPQFRAIKAMSSSILENKIGEYLQNGWKLHGPVLLNDGHWIQFITFAYVP